MHRSIVWYLHLELELSCSLLGDRGTEYTTPVSHHEVNLLWCDLLGSDDEVPFVLTVFVINDNDKVSITKVLESFLDRIQLDFAHTRILSYSLPPRYSSAEVRL